MRALVLLAMLSFAPAVFADPYISLYRAAGWPAQRNHFHDALELAQLRYRDSLPPAIYQALLTNSNRRFAPAAMDQRFLATLRQSLSAPEQALAFYQSPLGQRIVASEVRASAREQLSRYQSGLPRIEAGSNRQLLIRHLAQALPASEAGAEVSLALAGVAADSLSQMLPGLGGQAESLVQGQRQRLVQQIDADLDNTLLYIYRDLSDGELEQYLEFVRSEPGQRYFQAALGALRAGLAVGQPPTN